MYKQPTLWLGGYPRRTSQGIRIESNVIPSHQRLMHIHINNFPAGIFINLFRELKQWLCQFRLISDTECLHRCCCVTVMFSRGMAARGMRCRNSPGIGRTCTGNLRGIGFSNCVTCLNFHDEFTQMSFLSGHHTPSRCSQVHEQGCLQHVFV